MTSRRMILLSVLVLAGVLLLYNRPDEKGASSDREEPAAQQIEKAIEEGRPAWLFFRTSTCPACVELKRTFDRLEPDYQGKVVFIDINLDDDRNADLAREYRIGYVPQTFIANSRGEMVFQQVGTIEEDELQDILGQVAVPLE